MFIDLAQRLAQELQRNLPPLTALIPARELQTALQAALRRVDLVTREEFDAQAAVLQRTRMRLELLEQQVAQWEAVEQQTTENARPSAEGEIRSE